MIVRPLVFAKRYRFQLEIDLVCYGLNWRKLMGEPLPFVLALLDHLANPFAGGAFAQKANRLSTPRPLGETIQTLAIERILAALGSEAPSLLPPVFVTEKQLDTYRERSKAERLERLEAFRASRVTAAERAEIMEFFNHHLEKVFS